MKLKYLFSLSVIFLLLMVSSGFAVSDCLNFNDMGDNNQYIVNTSMTICYSNNSAGNVWYVNDSEGNGVIIINADNIVLDCNGTALYGNNTTDGGAINITGHKGVTIKGCNVSSYAYGIYSKSSNVTIDNSTIHGGSTHGVHLQNSSSCNVTNLNVTGFNYGLVLRQSSILNIIENNTFESMSTDGVYLLGVNNNTLTNNTANSNAQYGFYLTSSSYSILTNNTANSNSLSGIYLDSSSSSTLTNNTANNNTNYGIYLYSSSNNNTLTNNTANSNAQYGFYLTSSSYNTLTNNIANSNTKHGIYLISSSYSILTNNTANSNSLSGIYLDSSSSSTLTNNIANSNSYYGIYLESSSSNNFTGNNISNNALAGINMSTSTGNNLVWNNYFKNNTVNAYDPNATSTNKWNISKTSGTNIIGGPYIAGNYWDDYAGADSDGDGIGDTLLPYNASGNISSGGDYAPLVYTTVSIPTISVSAPPNASTTYNANPVIQYLVTDPDNASVSCTLFFNNVNQSFNGTTLNNTVSNFTLTDYATAGTFWYWINCSDGIGTNVTENRTLTIKRNINITLVSPANASSTYNASPIIDILTKDNTSSTESCTLFFNNANQSFNASVLNNTLSNFTLTNYASAGTFWYWANCSNGLISNVSNNNTLTIKRNIVIDVSSPPNATTTYNASPVIQYSVLDNTSSTSSCTLFWNLGNQSWNGSVLNNTLSNVTLTDYATAGTFWYWFSCSNGLITNVTANRTLTIDAMTSNIMNTNFTNITLPRILMNYTYLGAEPRTIGCSLFLNGTNISFAYVSNSTATNLTFDHYNINDSPSNWFWVTCSDNLSRTNTSGNFSLNTSIPPYGITGLSDDSNSPDYQVLGWTAPNNTDLYSFEIYKDGSWVSTVYAPSTSATITNLTADTTYEWCIYTVDVNGYINNTNGSPACANFTTAAGSPMGGGGGGSLSYCGDGLCQLNENWEVCPQDCPAPNASTFMLAPEYLRGFLISGYEQDTRIQIINLKDYEVKVTAKIKCSNDDSCYWHTITYDGKTYKKGEEVTLTLPATVGANKGHADIVLHAELPKEFLNDLYQSSIVFQAANSSYKIEFPIKYVGGGFSNVFAQFAFQIWNKKLLTLRKPIAGMSTIEGKHVIMMSVFGLLVFGVGYAAYQTANPSRKK